MDIAIQAGADCPDLKGHDEPRQDQPGAQTEEWSERDEVFPEKGHRDHTGRSQRKGGGAGCDRPVAGGPPVTGSNGGHLFRLLARLVDGGLLKGDIGAHCPPIMRAQDQQRGAEGEKK